MPRILIDATDTVLHQLNTGIQRVVHRISECSQHLQDELGVECIPIQYQHQRVYSAPSVAVPSSEGLQIGKSMLQHLAAGWQACRLNAAALAPAAAQQVHRAAVRGRKILYPNSLVRATRHALGRFRGNLIDLQPDDIILFLEAATAPPLYELGKRHGCFLAQVIYDVLPVTHSHLFEANLSTGFASWLQYVLARVDCFWSISQTTRNAFYGYYLEQRAQQQQQTLNANTPLPEQTQDHFRSFRLGADLAQAGKRFRVRRAIQHLADNATPFFFCIGTIEPRKNHAWVLEAFDKYWKQGGQANLVLTGRVGWLCNDICQAIEHHPLYGNKLFWYRDATDGEVQHLYKHARALVFASLAEGFGLPIVEALHYGTEVLASDTPIHHEVGGTNISYFSLVDGDDLVQQIHRTDQSPASARIQNLELLPSWEESTKNLLSDVLTVARQTKRQREEHAEQERAA